MRSRLNFIKLLIGLFFVLTSVLRIVPQQAYADDRIKPRIIDGVNVPASQFPSVALLSLDGAFCTGTLIAPQYILTAAHCFYDDRNRRAVGDADVVATLPEGSFVSDAVYIHPSFKSRSEACVESEHDAAIVHLSTAASTTPTQLYRSAVDVGATLLLAGFGLEGKGSTGQGENTPADGTINYGTTVVETVSNTYLQWIFTRNAGEANTAEGDSGGPAFLDVSGERMLAGITCGGTGNAEFGTESLDTRIDAITDWIDSVAGTSGAPTSPNFVGLSSQTGSVGVAFSYSLSVSGGGTQVISATGLPPGLSISGKKIEGTPTQEGSYDVALSVQNEIGSAQSTLTITILPYSPKITIEKALLQFDFTRNAGDFLFLRGKATVGTGFKPKGKKVRIQIGRYVRKLTLNTYGESSGSLDFALLGRLKGGAFVSSTVKFELDLENSRLFRELATLGFPTSNKAKNGDTVGLPISLMINDVELSDTITLKFSTRDGLWRKQ